MASIPIKYSWSCESAAGMSIVEELNCNLCWHDDVIKWINFPRYWSFVRGIHRSSVNSLHKGQWRGAFMFPLSASWTNGWVNNRDDGDLRRHRAHYDVIIMEIRWRPRVADADPLSNFWHKLYHWINNAACIRENEMLWKLISWARHVQLNNLQTRNAPQNWVICKEYGLLFGIEPVSNTNSGWSSIRFTK